MTTVSGRRQADRRSAAPAVVLALLATAGSGAAAPLAPAPQPERGSAPPPAPARLSVKAERGFIDDAFALDGAGRRLALIRTDREEFQRLELFDVEGGKAEPVGGFEVSPPARVIESLEFLPDGTGLLLAGTGPDGGHVVETTDLTGKVLGRANVPDAFATTSRAGAPLLVTMERREGKGSALSGVLTYVVSAFALPALKPIGKPRTYPVGDDGALKPSGLVPVGFFDGYSKLLARRPGAYDRKKDARQPDGQTVLDLLSGKPVSSGPIEDVYAWARLTRVRQGRANRTAFVQLAGANAGPAAPGDVAAPGANGVELVDPAGRLTALELAVPFRLYDRQTLKDQELPGATLAFALEVDPVNVDAVARKKADARALDVYTVPVTSPAEARRGVRVPLNAEPVVWRVAGNRVVVLRQFKSFARGGNRLDVYDLGK